MKKISMLILLFFSLILLSPTKVYALSEQDFVPTDVVLDKNNQAVGNGDTITITCKISSPYELVDVSANIACSSKGHTVPMKYDNEKGVYIGTLTIDKNTMYEKNYWLLGFDGYMLVNETKTYVFVGWNQENIGFGYFTFSFNETCKANGHSFNEGVQLGIPTCISPTILRRECTVCDLQYDEEILGEHSIVIDEAIPPTCTKNGRTEGTHCSTCNKVLVASTEVAATGHGKVEIKKQKKATYKEAGYTGDTYCTICHQKITDGKSIPKLKAKIQTIKVSGKASKTVKIKASKLKKKQFTFNISAKAKGKISYKITKGSKKYITVSKKGKVTIKKGCKKGTYKIKVTAAATSNGKYKLATKIITVKIQ